MIKWNIESKIKKEPNAPLRIFAFSSERKRDLLLIGFTIIIALAIRVWLISGNNLIFHFDQSRDAYVSQQILKDHNLKIQGPSASGTDDKIYHGVLYYYFISPFYIISNGDPIPVILSLTFITTIFTIIPLFYLTKEIAKNNKFAPFISILFIAISSHIIAYSTNLSNQTYSLPASTIFFYSLWKTFFDNKQKWFLVAMFFLGIAIQSGIYMIYLVFALVLSYFISLWKRYSDNVLRKKRIFLTGILIFFLTISSMIAAEALLIHRGILKISDFAGMSGSGLEIMKILGIIFKNYYEALAVSFIPTIKELSVILSIVLILSGLIKVNQKSKTFLIIALTSPFFLFILLSRGGQSYMISVIPIFYLLVSVSLARICAHRYGKIITVAILAFFLYSNVINVIQAKNESSNYFSVLKDNSLKDELGIIDYTYKKAAGAPFSISTLTQPFGYNTTWAYLYSWYGLEKYGYTPEFFGPSQIGIFGGDLISQSPNPKNLHFTIYESDEVFSQHIMKEFKDEQDIFSGPPMERKKFNGLVVEMRGGSE